MKREEEYAGSGRTPRAVFERLMDLPSGERAEIMAGLDERVRSRVAALLDAHEQERRNPMLETCMLAAMRDGAEAIGTAGGSSGDEDMLAGSMMGPYRLEARLGEGGFGVVYRAHQTKPVERTVALKVLQPSAESTGVLARFEDEQRALALLTHPSIAGLLDVGRGTEGRPYIAMEFVDGPSITSFADERRLGIRERIGLMLQVCEAVEHAHRKALIHRDLKPSNILVGELEGAPRVKVIDFGIAKAIEEGGDSGVTLGGQLLGTLEYMSPEQAAGRPVDTRTDVYAIGVVLHELLTGVTPLGSSRMDGSSPAELLRAVEQGVTHRPSVVFSKASRAGREPSDELLACAAARNASPGGLARALRGELDWIVLRCLERDRERRYGSVGALAQDLRRYLDGMPVEARPPSATYQTRKFIGRHRVAGGASAAALLALVGGAALAAWGLVQARREADEAMRERAVADAALGFLSRDLLGAASPAERGPDMPIGELLGLATDALEDGRYAESPRVEAAVRSAVGQMSFDLGLLDRAEENLRIAAMTWSAAEGPDSERAAGARAGVGKVLVEAGRPAEAEPILREALEHQRALHGEVDPRTIATVAALGAALETAGRPAEAIELYRSVEEKAVAAHGAGHQDVLTLVNNLATALYIQGRLDEALPILEDALRGCREALGDDHPDTITAISNLASVCESLGDYRRATALYEEAFASARRVLGDDHPRTLTAANNTAFIYERTAQEEDAERLYRDTLENRRRVLGERHPETLNTTFNLAALLLRTGRAEAAEPLFRTNLAGWRARVAQGEAPADNAALIDSMRALAVTMDRLGRNEEAARLMGEVAEMRRD